MVYRPRPCIDTHLAWPVQHRRREQVKVPLPRSYHSADATKGKVTVFKGVSKRI